MMWFFAALVVAVLLGIAVVASGRVGSMPPAYGDHPDVVLPDGPLGPDDLRRLRLPVTGRGYARDEVDALLDRLATQLEEQEGPADTATEDGTSQGRVDERGERPDV